MDNYYSATVLVSKVGGLVKSFTEDEGVRMPNLPNVANEFLLVNAEFKGKIFAKIDQIKPVLVKREEVSKEVKFVEVDRVEVNK